MTTNQQVNKFSSTALSTIFWAIVGEAVVPSIVGGVFWVLGAGYTILALQWFASAFRPVSDSFIWLLCPLLFSGVEVALWKLKLTKNVRRLALGMAFLDLVSSAGGLYLAITQSYIPRLSSVVVIQMNTTVYVIIAVIALGASWWITFSPERYLLSALQQVIEVIKFFRS